MKTHTEVREQMERVREQLRGLIAEGRGDEAVELAFTMLLQLQHDKLHLVLELELALERRKRAGRKTEKIDPAQLLLMLELMVTQAVDERTDLAATTAADEVLDREHDELETLTPSAPGRHPVRRRLPVTLPRDVIHHELAEDQRRCATCGEPMAQIGEDVSELLELVPAHFRVQEHHRAKYACGRCKEGVNTAPGPGQADRQGAGRARIAGARGGEQVRGPPAAQPVERDLRARRGGAGEFDLVRLGEGGGGGGAAGSGADLGEG